MQILGIILSVIFLVTSTSAQASCENSSVRVVENTVQTKAGKSLAFQLYDAAQKVPSGAWKTGEFNKEKFTYLGDFKTHDRALHVTFLETMWGASCRQTTRLMFWDKNHKLLGQYVGVEKPTMIANNTLLIPYEDQPDTQWIFNEHLPGCLNVANDCFPLER